MQKGFTMWQINGHNVVETYQGIYAWVVDDNFVFFHMGQLADFLGVDVDELREVIY